MESEEDTEDEADVSMYEKKVGCDLFYSFYVDASSRTCLLALAWELGLELSTMPREMTQNLRRI